MNPLIYTLRTSQEPVHGFAQGPVDGGVFITQTLDGNFVASHTKTTLRTGVYLNQWRFASIFGRVPYRGLPLRADIFIRLCTLGGLDVVFHDTQNDVLGSPSPGSLIRTEDPDAPAQTPGYALRRHPDGNFRVISATLGFLGTDGIGVSYDRFESMFGNEPRDYFANDALRVAALGGLKLTIAEGSSKDEE